jgi:hypothetical protein
MSAPLAGERVTVSQYPKVRVIKKAASETVTNSAAFQDDDDFTLTLDAGKTYEIRLQAVVTGPAAADVKFQWTTTGGVLALTNRHCIGPSTGVADALATTMRSNGAPGFGTGVSYGTDGTNGSRIEENFLVETTTNNTSGTLTLQWAQNTANVTGTAMNVNSYMVITEVDII